MQRVILTFDQNGDDPELRVKAIWPRIDIDSYVVPRVKGLYIQARMDDNSELLNQNAERVTLTTEIGDELSANDEVRPTIFRWDSSWQITVVTAVGIQVNEPQQSGYIPTDLLVPGVFVESDSISFAGTTTLSVITLVTIDYDMVTVTEMQFMELLLSRGMDLKDFFEMGRRLRIDTPLVERFRGLD